MKTITLNLNMNTIEHAGTCKNDWGMVKQFDSFKVKYTSGKMVYISVISNGLKLMEVAKKMNFTDGSVIISFGKNKINIGTYAEA